MITVAIRVRLDCAYCSRSRLFARADNVTDLARVARRTEMLADDLEARAVKAGWTSSAWTATLREWRCKRCTADLNART